MTNRLTRCAPMAALLFLAPAALRAQASPSHLSDAEIASVVVTADNIDIDLARFAETRSKNQDVLKFAATMITDHSAVNAQATALVKKLGVTPADNPVSQSLQKGAAEARKTLEPLKGSAFDQAYIGREVAYHQAVLDALDTLLIPSASNAELKQLLVSVRPAIAAHLAHAQMLQKSLASK
jgi:putative membrane protein